MTPDLLDLLSRVDTPTVCNAIEVAQGKRGFAGFTRGTMLCSERGRAIVGHAVTAQIAALSPPAEPPEVIRARRMAYYKAMHDGPKPSVAVVEDLDFLDCIGAYWGEVNTTIHRGFGMSGGACEVYVPISCEVPPSPSASQRQRRRVPGPTPDSTMTRQTIMCAKKPETEEEKAATEAFSQLTLTAVKDGHDHLGFKIRKSLGPKANEALVFGRKEPALQHHHDQVAKFAGDAS